MWNCHNFTCRIFCVTMASFRSCIWADVIPLYSVSCISLYCWQYSWFHEVNYWMFSIFHSDLACGQCFELYDKLHWSLSLSFISIQFSSKSKTVIYNVNKLLHSAVVIYSYHSCSKCRETFFPSGGECHRLDFI